MASKLNIQPNMRISILHTISKQIYSALHVKIREAVSNSYDNKASGFIYFFDQDNRTLSLYDNGTGIANIRMKEILEHIGYGKGQSDITQNSYFGLGLFSVLELGGRVDIYTKTSNGEYNHFYFNTKEIFNKNNAEKSISEIVEYFDNEEVTTFRTKSILSDEIIEECFGQKQNTFTEIVISDIKKDDMDEIASQKFRKDLEKILPLKYNKKHSFFNKITDIEIRAQIFDILDDETYCKSIDFFSGTFDTAMYKHERYFPQLRHNVKFEVDNIKIGKSQSGDFAYFFVYNYEDIENENVNNNMQNHDTIGFGNIDSETGFWVRNKNFLVKPADYFQKSGTRKRILDVPLSTWLYGEIFHVNMNDFLVVTRDEYVWSNTQFKFFFEEVKDLVVDLNKKLRDAWSKSNKITKSFYDPFVDIGTTNSPFTRINKKYGKEDIDSVDKVLRKLSNISLENDSRKISNLVRKHKKLFTIVDSEDFLIFIDPKNSDGMIKKQWDTGKCRPKIIYPASMFDDKKDILFGEEYNVSFVFGTENDSVLSVNKDKNSIYINPFNKNAIDYSLSKFDILFAIEFAYEKSKSKNEMRKNLYIILGEINEMSRTSVRGLFDVFSGQIGV